MFHSTFGDETLEEASLCFSQGPSVFLFIYSTVYLVQEKTSTRGIRSLLSNSSSLVNCSYFGVPSRKSTTEKTRFS